MNPGVQLRLLRERLGFTMKDVEDASLRLTDKFHNPKYWIPQSRLSHIENKGIVPSLYRLHAMAIIYRTAIATLMAWYGVEESEAPTSVLPPNTHLLRDSEPDALEIPVRFDPLFDPAKTAYIRRMIEAWGVKPLVHLKKLLSHSFTYGCVGLEDYTMYPLILPGSFLQLDPSVTTIETGTWSSEWERPIYFFETHSGYLIGWGAMVRSNELQVQPHALSGLPAKTYRYPNEIEVVGQVIGVATKLRSGITSWIERAQEAMREHS
jgi:transcriptional regulator with XRE-family HTH domain